MKIVLFLVTFVFNTGLNGQVLQFGVCPVVETVTFFDIESFLGTWYVIERFPAWFEHEGQCAYKRVQACGRRIEFEHAYVRNDIKFVLHVNSTYKPGADAVFEIEENNVDPVGIPLSVITTDYSNYALVYGCKVNLLLNIRYTLAWILSRTTTLDPEALKAARRTLISIPYTSLGYMEQVNQDDSLCVHHWTAHVHAVNTNDDN